MGHKSVFVVYDVAVRDFAKKYAKKFYGDRVVGELALICDEPHKTLSTVEHICRAMLQVDMDRSDILLSIGGGVCSDICGLAANLYKRGMRLEFVPTTLLSMADAAHGGKNGVNLDGIKNAIGSFKLPDKVHFQFEVLKTLPKREIISGCAEIIKTFLLFDKKRYFETIELMKELNHKLPEMEQFSSRNNTIGILKAEQLDSSENAINPLETEQFGLSNSTIGTFKAEQLDSGKNAANELEIKSLSPNTQNTGQIKPSLNTEQPSHKQDEETLKILQKLGRLAKVAAKYKMRIVRKDLIDTGMRHLLNYGHTFGHAIEWKQSRENEPQRYSHGEAVAIGMIQAQIISEKNGWSEKGLADKLKEDFQKAELPTELPYKEDELTIAIKNDKKAKDGKVDFVFIEKIGKARRKRLNYDLR